MAEENRLTARQFALDELIDETPARTVAGLIVKVRLQAEIAEDFSVNASSLQAIAVQLSELEALS